MPEYRQWECLLDTTRVEQNPSTYKSSASTEAPPRSVLVFAGSP
jgi:glycogen operon protein